MGWQISMILIDGNIPKLEEVKLVKKYFKSYTLQKEVSLDAVLKPSSNVFCIGTQGASTIITQGHLPYNLTCSGALGKSRHPSFTKLIKSYPDKDIFYLYFNSVGSYFAYTFQSKGVVTRYKRNLIRNDFELVEEMGNFLPEEMPYYTFSKIEHCEPGSQLNYGDSIKPIIIHKSLYSKRLYFYEKELIAEHPELKSLNEYQAGFEMMMDISKSFLGKRLDKIDLDKIKMRVYHK